MNQITRLYTLATAAGLDREGVHAILLRRYGVESSKLLTLRQYEQLTAYLQGSIDAQQRPPRSSADRVFHHPRVHNREGIAKIFRAEWPALLTRDPKLAADLIEVLDCVRLTRQSATISPRVVVSTIQKMMKPKPRLLAAAAATYLERYTQKDERYFLGILRGERWRERRRQRDEKQEHATAEQRDRQIAAQAQEIITAAGARPGDPAAAEGCVCDSGKLGYRPDEHAPFRVVPCPWCLEGRQRLARALREGQDLSRVNWRLVRQQTAERLEREAAHVGG